MRFKSVRCSSRVSAKVAFAACAALGSLASSAAFATITITPQNKGGRNIQNGTAYYFSTDQSGADVSATSFPDNNPDFPFGIVDLNATQVAGSSLADAIILRVNSNISAITPQAGQTAVLMVSTTGYNSGGAYYLPIAAVDNRACSAQGCNTAGIVPPNLNTTHYFAVPYARPGQYMDLYLFPNDLCSDYAQQAGQQAVGCGSGGLSGTSTMLPSTGASVFDAFQITVVINFLDSSGNLVQGNSVDTGTLKLRFQTDGPTNVTCPTNLSQLYFPGDGEIFFNATPFKVNQATGRAPLIGTFVVGDRSSVPAPTETNINDFEISARVGLGDQEHVYGFENATDASSNQYNLNFLVRDAAGLVTPVTSCTLSGVQTVSIPGFLSQSNCFIATAAFRSIDSAPVAMLRAFRDQVLLQYPMGRQFVAWYYDWSPAAAEWLMKNPEFRYPVLQALIPIQIAAWLILNPLYLMILFALTASTLVVARRRWV